MKNKLAAIMLGIIFSFSLVGGAMAQETTATTGGGLGDLISLTSGLSTFFGDAMTMMTQAIGYLTGGVQAAHLYQSGTNIINGMLVNGPKPTTVPLPRVTMPGEAPGVPGCAPSAGDGPVADAASSASGSAPATSGETSETVANVSSQQLSDEEFSGLLKGYNSLASEEKNLVEQMNASPEDASVKELYNQVQAAKLEKSSKIIASLNYDIEKQQYSKLNLLIEYVNVSGPQTLKVFAQVIDSTRGKLQFCLIEAKKYGLNLDIQVIEGKLKLVMSLTTGNFIPGAPPASVPMDAASGTSSVSVTAPKPTASQPEPNNSKPTSFEEDTNNLISETAVSETKTKAKTSKTKKASSKKRSSKKISE